MIALKKIFIVTFLFFVTTLTYAQVYKSTDAKGNIIYSDKPAGQNTQQINIDIAPSDNDSASSQRTQKLMKKQQKAQEQKTQQSVQKNIETKKQAYQKQVKTLCKTSQDNLKLLQETGRRVYTINPDGSYHYFSDEERKQEINRLKDQIKEYCQ